MESQPWLDEVAERLARDGLPPTYIQRFVAELTDHFHDLKEESMEADVISRLGEPEQVAEAAVTAYQRRSFLGRHPLAAFLFFGLSPVITLIALSIASVCLIGLIQVGIGIHEQPNHLGIVGSAIVNLVGSLLTVVIPSIIVAILYCRRATRSSGGGKWILASCATLAAFASSLAFWRAGSGPWMFGVLWPGVWCGAGWVALTQHLVNLIVPVVIGWWFMQARRDRGELQLAS